MSDTFTKYVISVQMEFTGPPGMEDELKGAVDGYVHEFLPQGDQFDVTRLQAVNVGLPVEMRINKKFALECGYVDFETQPELTIKGRLITDDGAFDVEFNAIRWFEQASDEEIEALARDGLSSGYLSDDVAQFCAKYEPNLLNVYKYLNLLQDSLAKEDEGGSTVRLHTEDVREWLKENRPKLFEKLENEELLEED